MSIATLRALCNVRGRVSACRQLMRVERSITLPMMKLHHVGIVVQNIERSGDSYAQKLGFRPLSSIFTDPLQRVRIQLWGNEYTVSLELIEPLGEDSPVRRFLEKGGGLHHLCFEVTDIVAAVEHARSHGGIVVSEPVPAVAFEGRRVAFLFFQDIGLVEFEEARYELHSK